VVTKISHILFAARLSSAAGVWGTHVGWDLANNVAKSHLVLDHLVVTILLRDSAQVQMCPGVGSKLVALRVHTLEDIAELRSNVNLSLVDVVSSDEESRLSIVRGHDIEDVAGENPLWAIVVGDGDCARCGATVDTSATILDVTDLSTSNGGGVGTTWGGVLRAAGAVLVVASRRVAVVVFYAAVACTRAALASGTVTDTGTTLAVILTGRNLSLELILGLKKFVDSGETSSSARKQVPSSEIPWVQSDDVGQSSSVSVDQGGNGCNSSESRGVVHVVRMWSVRITELNVGLIVVLREMSEWIVVVNIDDTL
jgi:hypothetical protein